jgi:hypothetical protein
MAGQTPITRWSVLALLVVVIGGAATLLMGQLWLERWAGTGQRAEVGLEQTVDLPAGETLVYYESAHAVPAHGTATLSVLDPYGRRVRPIVPAKNHDFRMRFSDWSGRALWKLEILEPGAHTVRCFNVNFVSDDDIPAGDRIVFGKEPGTLGEAMAVRKVILIVGAVATLVLAAVLYIMHGVALQRRRAADPNRSFPVPEAPAAPETPGAPGAPPD